jgi:hypothetical protein
METSVRIEKLDRVTVVTLDRADVRNAVDAETARALYKAFLAFDADTKRPCHRGLDGTCHPGLEPTAVRNPNRQSEKHKV